jgi:hypothetical protein
MHDTNAVVARSLSDGKVAYFEWRDSCTGYEDLDSNVEVDRERRRELRITAADETQWLKIKESEFRIEF